MENKGGAGGVSLHDGPRRGKNPDFNNNNILRILCACASADVGKRVTMSVSTMVSTKAPVSHLSPPQPPHLELSSWAVPHWTHLTQVEVLYASSASAVSSADVGRVMVSVSAE